MAQPGERRPSCEEFRKEVLVALRAAGLEGPFEHDEQFDRLLHTAHGAFDVRAAYAAAGVSLGVPMLRVRQGRAEPTE